MSIRKTLTRGAAFALIAPLTLGVAYAQDAQPAEPEAAPAENAATPPATLDTNGDGKMDAWDRDANGAADAWDTNGDGTPDAVDTNGDGKPDAALPQ
ncbi:hypothetical protein [Novosphingobium album (ex Liu et al. 2023)]|uniref:EF-hand domain-containing protein n=1 Tax=Novosphingobium album (ex Liu et al. 2023) TaxID=3031130 RepID=A0ABT5WLC9_9SPHN|nr:hypothetical protein [Novosphingobium album (ex Liu et al. 2023)]MDE8650684.1 hypothetical protein [Novosphingobium album (ex Liu et al. 2023)]